MHAVLHATAGLQQGGPCHSVTRKPVVRPPETGTALPRPELASIMTLAACSALSWPTHDVKEALHSYCGQSIVQLHILFTASRYRLTPRSSHAWALSVYKLTSADEATS